MIIKSTDINLLKNDTEYQSFISNNPSRAFVKVRASSVNEALPIKDLEVTISKKIGNNTIIFYEGKTDESGMINGITLPAPIKVKTNEDIPEFTKYDLNATYLKTNFKKTYQISVCCGITVVQHINIIPYVSQERNNYGY